ncbi:MAG: FliI/YscN family ATPase, partial [Marivita sp.]|uniref:FliI/YscN family ATPase n=1 Tax=Marivita sp. TaxID=2003365 RepID=UPI003EF1AF5A
MTISAAFASISQALDRIEVIRPQGAVIAISGGTVLVGSLPHARLGDRLIFVTLNGRPEGEVTGLSAAGASILLGSAADGLALGDAVTLHGPRRLRPDDSWIGRVVDPDGKALDDMPLLQGARARSIDNAPPSASRRRALGARLETGSCIFNTILPLARGQRTGLFAGSGVGKSTLLAQLCRNVEADVIVIALIGERGRELRQFIEEGLGQEGLRRAVVVAATADQPAHTRRRCAGAAMAIAEHFRDQGRHVLLLADSVTRMAEAHREVALGAGETAPAGGFPASTAAILAGLCERAGPGVDGQGDITAVFAVLVAGSDMEGPIADLMRGILDGHIVLDRTIAERGRFPAVDVLRSVSRALPQAALEAELALITEARRLLGAYDRAEMMVQAGLYESGSDALID